MSHSWQHISGALIYIYAPFWLWSRDGSCCKVKIVAVILGEPKQTDNSWHRCGWQRILPSCAGDIPVQVSFSLTNKGCFFSVSADPMSFLLQVSPASLSSWTPSLLSPFHEPLLPTNMLFKEKYLCSMVIIFFIQALTQCWHYNNNIDEVTTPYKCYLL